MYIGFQGEIGAELIKVNSDGIVFCDGFAYFTDTKGNDYTIEVRYIIQIIENP